MSRAEAELWRGDRIGVFGGTFDPPHTGHVRMALHARTTLGLERVLFSVAPRPPHKPSSATSPLEHRVAMVRLALAPHEGLAVTGIEEEHDVSFTVDLLRACRARSRADLYFIIGADSLTELPAWKEPEGILQLATLVVYARNGAVPRLEVPGPAALVVFESPRFDVSSTEMRARVAAHDDGAEGISPEVAAYAARHGLYVRNG